MKHPTSDEQKLARIIHVAAGREPADLVLKNATFVNVFTGMLGCGDIAIADGIIAGIGNYRGAAEEDCAGRILCPGLIDAHVHLESSLVMPWEFSRAVLPHGTTTVVTDPHEIANVMGRNGIDLMLSATEQLPVDIFFMLPSCVPATPLEENGAKLNHGDLARYLDHPRVLGLAEVMDSAGVVQARVDVLQKIRTTQSCGKICDGHAPGLTEHALNAYIAAGIFSDHECAAPEEALEKIRLGQHIMIREGTAARNLQALIPLLQNDSTARRCMFCTDDKHPGDLLNKGHIDHICREAVRLGADPVRVIRAATWQAAQYFGLRNRGAIAPGFLADIIAVENLEQFHVTAVFRKGEHLYQEGLTPISPKPTLPPHLIARAHDTFHLPTVMPSDLKFSRGQVIGMLPGEIITTDCGTADGIRVEDDILKIVLAERHHNTGHMGLGYLAGFGLKSGAIAASVAHDSHNIIAVGCCDEDIACAINRVATNRGGIVVAECGKVVAEVPLEIAGLMTERPLTEVSTMLENAKAAAYARGVHTGVDPFMTLSFMALPVIPTLRLTTRGIVTVK